MPNTSAMVREHGDKDDEISDTEWWRLLSEQHDRYLVKVQTDNARDVEIALARCERLLSKSYVRCTLLARQTLANDYTAQADFKAKKVAVLRITRQLLRLKQWKAARMAMIYHCGQSRNVYAQNGTIAHRPVLRDVNAGPALIEDVRQAQIQIDHLNDFLSKDRIEQAYNTIRPSTTLDCLHGAGNGQFGGGLSSRSRALEETFWTDMTDMRMRQAFIAPSRRA